MLYDPVTQTYVACKYLEHVHRSEGGLPLTWRGRVLLPAGVRCSPITHFQSFRPFLWDDPTEELDENIDACRDLLFVEVQRVVEGP